MKIRKILAAVASAAVAVSALATAASAADYNGYITFQTTQYSFRNEWDEGSYGVASDYFDDYIAWGNNDPETWPEYEDNFDYDIEGYVLPATYTDAAITGDGTYTVKAADLDWAVTGDSDFNLIGISTDIPMDAGAVCTSATVIVDGEAVKTYENPVCDDTKKYFNIYLTNIWNAEIGSYGLAYPTSTLEIEFTITGLGSAAEEAPADTTEAPAAGDVDASTDSSKGSPDTGVEDVAVVAGLAIVAGAAIALTRKRK